jgi:hypothetical protein
MRKFTPISLLFIVFILVLDMLCIAQVKTGQPSLVITPAVTRTVIDSIRQALNRYYIFPDAASKMAAYLEQEFKKGAYKNIKDPQELAKRLEKDIQKAHHDGHFRFDYAPDFARRLSDTTGQAQRRPIEAAEALADMRKRNFLFVKAEVLPGNIGYVAFNGFTGFVKEARPTFTSAFRFVANTNALIIDLRNNGGGSPDMVNQVESYFFSTKTHLNDIVDRLSGNTTVYWTDPAKADSVILQMPVYILTSKGTFSGAEDFTYGMQSVKRAVVVGDTTGGGAHPVRPFDVGQGFVAGIPFARSLNPYTNTDWEGTGVIPDIPVSSDKALATAQTYIFTQQLKDAKTEKEVKKLQWQIKSVKAMQPDNKPDSTALAGFTGIFQGGLNFYVRGNDLYCKNAERGNAIYKLNYITGSEFLLDENVQVEFIKDASQKVAGIKMHWVNGGETYRPRDTSN